MCASVHLCVCVQVRICQSHQGHNPPEMMRFSLSTATGPVSAYTAMIMSAQHHTHSHIARIPRFVCTCRCVLSRVLFSVLMCVVSCDVCCVCVCVCGVGLSCIVMHVPMAAAHGCVKRWAMAHRDAHTMITNRRCRSQQQQHSHTQRQNTGMRKYAMMCAHVLMLCFPRVLSLLCSVNSLVVSRCNPMGSHMFLLRSSSKAELLHQWMHVNQDVSSADSHTRHAHSHT